MATNNSINAPLPLAVAQGGTGATSVAAARGGLAIGFGNMTVFTANGTFTSDANTTRVFVRCWGPGGGGGGGDVANHGAGGGGGGYAEGYVTISASTGYAITVGGGGSGGATTVNGSAGSSSSSFAASIVATAGQGGVVNGAGGAAGTGTAGDLLIAGQDGTAASAANISHDGGNAPFFGAAGRTVFVNGSAESAAVYACGGGGCYNGAAGSGGNGSNGLVIVYY